MAVMTVFILVVLVLHIADIFALLVNCSVFSVLDLTGAYQQVLVSECLC